MGVTVINLGERREKPLGCEVLRVGVRIGVERPQRVLWDELWVSGIPITHGARGLPGMERSVSPIQSQVPERC